MQGGAFIFFYGIKFFLPKQSPALRYLGVERANALREVKEQRPLRGKGRRPF